MQYITIPEPVVLKDHLTNEPKKMITFFEFVQGTLLVEKRFGKSVKELQAALRIAKAFRGAESPTTVSLETQDWELLRDVAKEPEGGYLPGVAVQLLPFISAIIDATDKIP